MYFTGVIFLYEKNIIINHYDSTSIYSLKTSIRKTNCLLVGRFVQWLHNFWKTLSIQVIPIGLWPCHLIYFDYRGVIARGSFKEGTGSKWEKIIENVQCTINNGGKIKALVADYTDKNKMRRSNFLIVTFLKKISIIIIWNNKAGYKGN